MKGIEGSWETEIGSRYDHISLYTWKKFSKIKKM